MGHYYFKEENLFGTRGLDELNPEEMKNRIHNFRKEVMKRRNGMPDCTDCHKSARPYHPYNDYMLTPDMWKHIHPEGYRGFLCYECLNNRAKTLNIVWSRDHFTSCLCYINMHFETDEFIIHRSDIVRKYHNKESMREGFDVFQLIMYEQVSYIREAGIPSLPYFLSHLALAPMVDNH